MRTFRNLSLLLILVAGFGVQGDVSQKPNIVFFIVDDLGWMDVAVNGSELYETPNIDRLASEGVRFTSAYAVCHVCSPTRGSILTGKYPARNGLTDWIPGRSEFAFQKLLNVPPVQAMPYEEITLAETLQAQGYRTSAIGKWHLGYAPSGPEAHGFDHRVPQWDAGWALGFYAPFPWAGLEGPKDEYLTDRLAMEAVNFIEASKDQPFFLYMSHYSVHDPIQGRPDLTKKYEAKIKRQGELAGPDFILEGNPDAIEPISRGELDQMINQKAYAGFGVLPRGTVKIKQKQDNANFAAMVQSVDMSLGRILKKLKELSLEDNTVIVFYSDNGGMSGMNVGNPMRRTNTEKLDRSFSSSNLPLRGAKGWLYEGGIRVPLIVKWPGQGMRGAVSDEPVTSTDFYPTLLEMAGLDAMPQQHQDGLSLVPLLKKGAAKKFNRDAIYWHFPHYSNHGMQPPSGAVRAGDWKLIEYYENGTVQLFNLHDDLGEQKDLAAAKPAKAAELRRMLQEWRTSVGAKMNEVNPQYDPKVKPWEAKFLKRQGE